MTEEEELRWSFVLEDSCREIQRAYRTTRRSGVCGMSIEAQFNAEFAPEISAFNAVIAVMKHHGFEPRPVVESAA